MKIDDAEIYFLNFETDLDNDAGGTHIGMFLGWAIQRGLADPRLLAHLTDPQRGKRTGRDLLFDHCDGKLLDGDLSVEGAAFARAYYDADYLKDYMRMFALDADVFDDLGKVSDDAQAQARVSARLDRRYSAWRMRQQKFDPNAMHQRLLALAGPVLDAAGFSRQPASGWSADSVETVYLRSGPWGRQRVELYAAAREDMYCGLGLRLQAWLEPLYTGTVAEMRIEDPRFHPSTLSTATIPLDTFARGWAGPVLPHGYCPVIWTFHEEEVAPLAQFIAARLRDFALPLLRGIESDQALCTAFDVQPLSDSPLFRGGFDYAVPLAFERARHPRLPAVLDAFEAWCRARVDPVERAQARDVMALIGRIRARAPMQR
jgi:hypothetical protein